VFHQQVPRGAHDASALGPANAVAGIAEAAHGAQAHFGDHQHFAIQANQVELPEAAAVVRLDNRETPRHQVRARNRFRGRSDGLPIHGGACALPGRRRRWRALDGEHARPAFEDLRPVEIAPDAALFIQ
jgi:hypothetical protein